MEEIFEKTLNDLGEQNEFLLTEIIHLGKYDFDYVSEEAATIVMPLVIDTLHKQRTVIELIEEGLTSEAAVILRSIYEQVYHIIYIIENPESSRKYLSWKKYRESLGNPDNNIDKPEDEFPKLQTIVKTELGEEKYYNLYRKLSQYSHPSLQQFRDIIDVDEENENFLPKDRKEFEDEVLAFLIYTTYKMVDKMNFQGIAKLVKFEDKVPKPFRDYSTQRNQAVERMDELRELYSKK